MSQRIRLIVAAAILVVGVFGVTSAALAQRLSWGQVKCLYAPGGTAEKCGLIVVPSGDENKNQG